MIRIRRAGPDDEIAVLAWRNDVDTRRASLSHDEVSAGDHAAWYARSLGDPQRALYIGEVDDDRIGVVRFDVGDAFSIVSINLAPEHRGKGLSRPLLAGAIAEFEREQGAPQELVAFIRTDNPASARIFRSLGFEGDSGDDVLRVVRRAS